MKKYLLVLFLMIGVAASAQDAQPKTTVQWKSKTIDMGLIKQGIPAKAVYEFTNTGKTPLIISKVSTSCGCTVASYTKEPIAPGKKGTIEAIYNAATPGDFHKNLTVIYNGEDEMVLLNLQGTVEAPAQK
jgi:hypothetical protein